MTDDGSTLEPSASARLPSHQNFDPKPTSFALGVSTDQHERDRRPSNSGLSALSLSHSSPHSARPISPRGTYVSNFNVSKLHSFCTAHTGRPSDCCVVVAAAPTSDAGSSRGSHSHHQGNALNLWPSIQPSVDLPVYSRGVADPAPRESEADRVKRLYLCPWERTSPRTFLKFREEARGGPNAKSEKEGGAWPAPTAVAVGCREERRRKLIVAAVSFLVLLLFADLLLLNIALLPLAFLRK